VVLRYLGMDTPHGRQLLTIQMAVFLDMLAVSFFVPLLPFYWKQLGVRPELLGLISSVYSLSQIASGVVLGYVSDHVMGRKGVLLMSFVGSAVSYSLAALSFRAGVVGGVIMSRVIVGLVKQTMTISKAAVTSITTEEERTSALSHMRATLTLAFMVGPTAGGLLAKWFDKSFPAYVASAIFVFNFALVWYFMPDDLPKAKEAKIKAEENGHQASDTADTCPPQKDERSLSEETPTCPLVKGKEEGARKKGLNAVLCGIWNILAHPGLGRITCIKFVNSVLVASMYAISVGYTAEKYNLEPHHLGYLSTAQSFVSLGVQFFAIAEIAKRFGEERTLQGAFVLAGILSFVEATSNSMYLYVAMMPLRTLAGSLITQMFEVMFTELVPPSESAAAFGSMGLLKSIARVCGPLYGGILVGHVQPYFGLQSRPLVETFHNVAVLVALLMCYPLHKVAEKTRSKTE